MKIFNDYNMQGVSRIVGLPAPVGLTEPARLGDLNSAMEGLKDKGSARVSTQGNIDLSSPGATIDGITMDVNDVVLVRNQTAPAENGIYTWFGAAVQMIRAANANTSVELEQAVISIEEGTDANTVWRQASVNFILEVDPITFFPFGANVPNASETVAGRIQITTQAETNAETDNTKAVTPAKLGAWTGKRLKFAAVIGDNSATQFDVTHNFNTLDVTSKIYEDVSGAEISCDTRTLDVNTVRLNFTVAPAVNELRVVIIG
jgi:hypothetical protein